MFRNPITVCLYTSTKGHFGKTDIYEQTVKSLFDQAPKEVWGALLANVKEGGTMADAIIGAGMAQWLEAKGFTVCNPKGEWRHGDHSHQEEYIKDMMSLISMVKTQYILHMEDDWIIKPYINCLEYWIHEATSILATHPEIVQVRIPRYSNELDRINGLFKKHGIDGRAQWEESNKWFFQNDWANHPSIIRTRDLRAALTFVMNTNLPKHSEHGVGAAMKLLSGAPLPFACFNPDMIRVGHLGVAHPVEADDLSKPLMAS